MRNQPKKLIKLQTHPVQAEFAPPLIFSHPDYTVGTGVSPVQPRIYFKINPLILK